MAMVAKNWACRSLCTIWVLTGAGFRPSRAQANSSTSGGMFAKVPTAPETLPYEMTSKASSIRLRFRCISEYHRANLRPKVMGSAWIPWDRPITGVCLNS